MSIFDEDLPQKQNTTHIIGADLTLLSVDELTARINILTAEIARLEDEREKKSVGRRQRKICFAQDEQGNAQQTLPPQDSFSFTINQILSFLRDYYTCSVLLNLRQFLLSADWSDFSPCFTLRAAFAALFLSC